MVDDSDVFKMRHCRGIGQNDDDLKDQRLRQSGLSNHTLKLPNRTV